MPLSFTKESKTIFLLWLSALGLRILYSCLFTDEFILGNDQVQNIILARRFGAGDFYGVLHTYWTPVYPILIGIVSFFTNSLTLPSTIVSILAGSLAIPLFYFFVKQSYGQREALIAAVLAVFYPHLVNSSVFEVGSENIYLLWIVGSLFFGWKALQNNNVKNYLLTGVLLGLAYLTRPEAFAYPFYFAALACVKNLIEKTLVSRGILLRIAVLILGFTVLATPYILYLKSETGIWTVSAKAQKNIASGAVSEFEDKEDTIPKQLSLGKTIKSVVKEIPLSLVVVHKNLPYLLPIFLMLLIGLGLFNKPWDRSRLEREIYLILFCLITFLGYAATVVQTRYFYILLPIFFGWIAAGIIRFEIWFYDSFPKLVTQKEFSLDRKKFLAVCLLLIFLYTLPLNYFINKRDTAFEERDAGLWLKENSKPSPLVYSASLLPVFYAEGTKLKSTLTDQEQILELIESNPVDFVITGERSEIRNTYLKGFTEKLENSPDFELIYRNNKRTKYEISIFRVKRDGGFKNSSQTGLQ